MNGTLESDYGVTFPMTWRQESKADPNMTPETKAALEALVRAAKKHMDDKPLADWDNIRVCVVCHDRECVAPATKCGSCLMQEMIDEVG